MTRHTWADRVVIDEQWRSPLVREGDRVRVWMRQVVDAAAIDDDGPVFVDRVDEVPARVALTVEDGVYVIADRHAGVRADADRTGEAVFVPWADVVPAHHGAVAQPEFLTSRSNGRSATPGTRPLPNFGRMVAAGTVSHDAGPLPFLDRLVDDGALPELLPWQRDVVRTYVSAAASGRQVTFMSPRVSGRAAIRRRTLELLEHLERIGLLKRSRPAQPRRAAHGDGAAPRGRTVEFLEIDGRRVRGPAPPAR